MNALRFLYKVVTQDSMNALRYLYNLFTFRNIRTAHLPLIELPEEVLTKIFSYLNLEELVCASKVCTRLNCISKAPSLWQDVRETFCCKQKLISFCKYFCEVNYIRKLSIRIDLRHFIPLSLDEETTKAVNQLFDNLKQLQCLEVEYLELKNIALPQQLKHLSCVYSNERNDVMAMIETIKSCPSIEYLYLDDDDYYATGYNTIFNVEKSMCVDLAVKDLIHKFESTLSGLYLSQKYFSAPSLTSYSQLKVLGLCFENDSPHRFELLMSISKLPCLEVLSLEKWYSLDEDLTKVLGESGNRFRELRYLSIVDCFKITKRTYDLLYTNGTKLGSFCLGDTVIKASDLCSYLKKCKSLQNICLHPAFISDRAELNFVKGMRKLLSERTFQRICLPVRNCDSNTVSDLYIKALPSLAGKCLHECVFRYGDDNACIHCDSKCRFWRNFPKCYPEIPILFDLF